ALHDLAVFAILLDDRLQVAMLLRRRLELLLVAQQRGIAELAAEFLVALFKFTKAVKHKDSPDCRCRRNLEREVRAWVRKAGKAQLVVAAEKHRQAEGRHRSRTRKSHRFIR